jgi:hypothetical protein
VRCHDCESEAFTLNERGPGIYVCAACIPIYNEALDRHKHWKRWAILEAKLDGIDALLEMIDDRIWRAT